MVLLACLWAADQLTSEWKALLNKETQLLKLWSGVGVFFSANTHPLGSFTSVVLSPRGKAGGGSSDWGFYSVELKSPTRTVAVSGSNDRDEALELAQALSRFLGVDLSVDGGHARPPDARLEAAPLEREQAPPSLPPGSRIRVRQGAQGLVLQLPGCGWRPLFVVKAGIALVIAVGGPAVFGLAWVRTYGLRQLTSAEPLMALAVFLCLGGLLLWSVIREVNRGWSLAASSQGIEHSRTRGGKPGEVTRLPASQIEDIDLREPEEEFFGSLTVVIEHKKGFVRIGAGLSREELEWTETMLRRALATRRAPRDDGDSPLLMRAATRN
ncbi:hypothetical protein COCOR_04603 [Corallococcus coralloides DSM 2259]|uniref:Uncharacterized protein n=1 Tax=Corallococcus coralloides (strain ATCC 25202 / DSM 2259 / NBRC 100086 / M2) TaxID=1144275 RepID=H8MI22_CORCM|nr:hypothetical protein [Corallococcus coralloides]AFE05918.1 hypothetical protein COCOR_04603 [Corallococcus coralloides DSM 2259]